MFSRSLSAMFPPAGLLVAVACQLCLAACGGGGGGDSIGTPRAPVTAAVPVPPPRAPVAPPAAPGPALPASSFDTAEFRLNTGLALTNPTAAYARGITGRGVTLAILDTGLDIDSAEFSGRLASGSGNFLPGGVFDDVDGHGTAVASVILGAKNDVGTHGVAYEATLFSGRILSNFLRARTGNPSQAEVQQENVDFYNGFANGLNAARNAGAQAVNLSIGFSSVTVSNPGAAPPPSAPFDAAIAQSDAAIAAAFRDGVVFVIAAGNDSGARPNAFPRQIFTAAPVRAGEAPVLIVGALNSDGQTIASFSDRAGTGPEAQYYLAAPGVRIQAPDNTGALFNFSGTSLAAPHVTGALGLLLQAFPNLTGPRAADLLLTTATDLGDPGTDAIYGRGALNIARAFQPQGSQRIATAGGAVSLNPSTTGLYLGNGTDGARALRAALSDVVFQDDYDRVFHADVSGLVNSTSGNSFILTQATQARTPAASHIATGNFRFSAAATRAFSGATDQRPSHIQGFAQVQASPHLALWISGGGSELEADASRFATHDLVTQTAASIFGRSENEVASGLSISMDDIDVGARWQQGSRVLLIGRQALLQSQSVALSVGKTSEHSAWQAQTQLVWDRAPQESAQHSTLLATSASQSVLGKFSAAQTLANVTLTATVQIGQSQAQSGTGLITRVSPLLTSAFSAQAAVALPRQQELTFGLAQPTRIERGTLNLAVPTSFDYGANQIVFSHSSVSLAPRLRELDAELGYRLRWRDTFQLNASVYHRFNPEHQSGSDTGTLLSIATSF